MPSDLTFLRYTDSVETKLKNEDEISEKITTLFGKVQRKMAEKRQHAPRGAHAKNHGILKGELTVYDDLPEVYQQGAFKAGKTYPVMLRLSTAPSDHVKDAVGGVRGLAIKLMGIQGEQCLPETGPGHTQDFLLINHPTFAVTDVAGFLLQAELLDKVISNLPEAVQVATGTLARGVGSIAHAAGFDPLESAIGLMKPESHILGQTFHTTAPLRYGEYVAKVSIAPLSSNVKALQDETVDVSDESALLHEVQRFFNDQGAEYELRVQLCTNLQDMPVEDLTVKWPEDQSPYYPVAKITLQPQNAGSPARSHYGDDVLSFTPWNALVLHRPLGSIMRSRKPAYEDSSRYRHERNSEPKTEPVSLDEMPD